MKITKEQWKKASMKGTLKTVETFIDAGKDLDLTEEQKEGAEFKTMLMMILGSEINGRIAEKYFTDQEEIEIGEDDLNIEMVKILENPTVNEPKDLGTRTLMTIVGMLVAANILKKTIEITGGDKNENCKAN